MDREDVVYIHNGILPSNKKEWSLAIYNDLDGVREKEAPYDFTHMWNLRNKTNEHGEKYRQTQKQPLNYREQTDGYQMGGG